MNVVEEPGARPILLWTDDVVPEALRQLRNTARLPIIDPHGVAVMPDVHYGIGATVGSVIATQRAIVPAAVGVDIGCFRGDTKVPLLDGTQANMVELARCREPFWVYSIDSKLRVVPGLARCIQTRESAQVLRLVVSGGHEIVCTPDHAFMLTDGTYRQAKDLTFNQSLMPLYRRWQTREGYESVSNAKAQHRQPRSCVPGIAAREHGCNHKVIAIEPLLERSDVYCLQVDAHHNFALAAGVFVHNCGMNAVRTSLTANDLPDSLSPLRHAVERSVPLGAGGAHRAVTQDRNANPALVPRYRELAKKHPKLAKADVWQQLGSLGSGNHFIEVCLDEQQAVWVMLHSGSRGIGNLIGRHFIERAKRAMERQHVKLPDADLAYLPEDSDDFNDYLDAVGWAQDYALENRRLMMDCVLASLKRAVPKPFEITSEAINCHHNYVERETHFGRNIWVTRKGAIRARKDELGIIPGSMGQRSYIVRGLGNPDSYCSCSHGAGRRMSRGAAKKTFTVADLVRQTQGVECRKDHAVLDEIPGAYKDIDEVMRNQRDLIEVVHTLKQVMCVKGA